MKAAKRKPKLIFERKQKMEEKVCGVEVALGRLSTTQLLDAVCEIARENHDGHYTIMSFTTGYRIGFGTPDLDVGFGKNQFGEESEGRKYIRSVPHIKTMFDSLIYAIMYEPVFGEFEK
jgi:hypothetical protein